MHSPSFKYGWPRRKALFITAALTTATMLLLLLSNRSHWMLSSSIETIASSETYDSTPDIISASQESSASQSLASSTKLSTTSSTPASYTPPESLLGIYELIKPHIHPITAESFTSRTGKVYRLPSKKPRFTQSLGKKVLILDVESRDISSAGGLLDKDMPFTDGMQLLTFGRLNHYIFAILHGYDYQLVQMPDDPTLHGTWYKVPAMREAIKKYEYVVFMDGDAIFTHLHLPLEWLMNRWEISNDTTLALAEDPDTNPIFFNLKGLDVNLNTGFVIAHQTPRSEEFFDAWMTCPDETRYEGCAKWRLTHTHEQAVVNEYLRYDYPDELKFLPCTEANRYPGSGDCEGEFVSHFWPYKEMIPDGAKEVVAQYFWPPLQQAFSHDGDKLVVTPRE